MHFDVKKRTILMVRHGSHAYGLNIATSDEDFKGVCIKPRQAYFGFTQKFEQHEHMGSKSDGVDSVTYSLDKFASLAADCNPNIIEVLHVDDADVVQIDSFGEELRARRDEFISKKARFTFAGYAHAQLNRIETHRSWLLKKPNMPNRSDYGLEDAPTVSATEIGALDSLLGVDNIDDRAGDPGRVDELEELAKKTLSVKVPRNLITLFTREKAFRAAEAHYQQFLNWQKSRNPARAELEAKYGYDTKHGMHLIRLMRMCKEILVTGKVNVKRPDRDELLEIRFGQRSYDSLIDEAKALDALCKELYDRSALAREPNRAALDEFIVDLTHRYIAERG